MPGNCIKVRSSEGGDFDCYLNVPDIGRQVPAAVLASAVHGVDDDIIAIADELAGLGFIAAAPDLFWRTLPGPLSHDDRRAQERSQPRLDKIRQGEADMVNTLARLGELPEFNGSAVAMGFCYGGPYAILGPKRLGYAAGIACHGTQMLDYLQELGGHVRARLHHVGRSGPPSSGRSVECLSRCGVTKEQCGGAYLSGRAARLHDARNAQGLRPSGARVFHDACSGDS
jgi:dienelactone hydrolase